MKCLIIGYGSIGQRHARVLHEMGHDVAIVSQGNNINFPVFRLIVDGVETWKPDYVIIANDTRLHADALEKLAGLGYAGVTLVEKPLASRLDELASMPSGPVFVGYTLRFHPLIQRLSESLCEQPLWTLTAYVGQYLPDWRPDRDYRHSYSARRTDGGVIRDLSHELDYAQVLAGRCKRTMAAGGHLSSLEIESEDAVTLLAEFDRCPLVTIHVNYLDRSPSRWIVANGPMGTLRADLVKGVFALNDEEVCVPVVRDSMIQVQHIAAMNGDLTHLCTLADARYTMQWIDAAHESMRTSNWVNVQK